ncbi:MAG: DMT family transporter, partial [Mangrovicoccus sp.]
LEDVFIKTAAAEVPGSQVLLLIGLPGMLIFMAWARWQGEPVVSKALFTLPVMIRNFGEVIGTAAIVQAFILLPLSTSMAIFQATPLVVTLGAALFLGAQVGWRRWSAIAVGFFGVLLIIRPGMEGFDPATIFPVITTLALAARDLATRWIPSDVSSAQLSTYGFGSVAVAGLVLLPFGGPLIWPGATNMTIMGGALAFGVIGYYWLTAANRVGEVAVVTPFRYTRLLFALILGALVFAERPDVLTLTGAALILASGLYTLMREAHARSRPLSTGKTPG